MSTFSMTRRPRRASASSAATNFDEAKATDEGFYARFFHEMLQRGVYLAPSAFEAGFVSIAHGHAEIDATIAAAARAFRHVRG